MKPQELSNRTYEFGVGVVNFCKTLPDGPEARRIRAQLADSGTSVASNYRGACRARSRAEFISKIAICAEEADESHMWLQMCVDVGLSSRSAVAGLLDEAEQLRRIFIASQLTAKRRKSPMIDAELRAIALIRTIGQPGHEDATNHRNGTGSKTLLTDDGPLPIEVPRDREGTFEPRFVPKHERRFTGLDDRI